MAKRGSETRQTAASGTRQICTKCGRDFDLETCLSFCPHPSLDTLTVVLREERLRSMLDKDVRNDPNNRTWLRAMKCRLRQHLHVLSVDPMLMPDAIDQLGFSLDKPEKPIPQENEALKHRVIEKCKNPSLHPKLTFREVKEGTGWGRTKLHNHFSHVEDSDPARWHTRQIAPFILGE